MKRSLPVRASTTMPELRALEHRRIAVTRAADQAAPLLERLRALGAEPLLASAIQILPPEDPLPLRAAARSLGDFDWVVLTSANAARALLELAPAATWPAELQVAAVGRATARVLAEGGARPPFQPTQGIAETLARELPIVAGARVLWPKGDIAQPVLSDGLAARGARVTAPIAYRTVAGVALLALADALRDGRVDALTFTSASTVRHVVEGLELEGLSLPALLASVAPGAISVVCLGPVTAAAARECGLPVTTIAEPHDDDGLIDALCRTLTPRGAAA